MQTDKNHWQPLLDVNNPTELQIWLSHAGSFMQRLEDHGIKNPTIDVIREDWFIPEAWESELLQLKSSEQTFIREVCIYSDTKIWLYGRTVVPQDMLRGKQELSHLKNRPLGSVLFQDPEIKRDKFEFTYIEPGKLWQGFSPVDQQQASWVRRSLFKLYDHSLLLTEILMPDLTTLCMKN